VDLGTFGLAVGATLCWSSTWVMMKAGVDRMDRTAFGLLRMVFGLLFILPFALLTGGIAFPSTQLAWVAMSGGFLNAVVGNAFFYYALSHGSMHESNILVGISPFWGVVGAILVLGEPVRWVTFAAAILVVFGTILLVWRSKDDRFVKHKVGPILAALGTGICYGFSTTVPAKICMSQGMDPISYQFLFTVTGLIGWTIASIPRGIRGKLTFSRQGVFIAAISGVSGLFLGWVLWLEALKRVDASALSPVYGLTMLFAVLIGALFMREPITRRIAFGGVFVLAGITLVTVVV
jgi:drug/metabolite transporter (DMT)-like permease